MSAPSSVSISNIINLTGVVGLLVSLWFVNEEIEQSRLLAEAELIQNRNMSLMAFYSAPLEGSNLAAQLNSYNGYNYGLGNPQQMEYTYQAATQIYDNCPLRELVIQRVPTNFLLEVQRRSTNDCSV